MSNCCFFISVDIKILQYTYFDIVVMTSCGFVSFWQRFVWICRLQFHRTNKNIKTADLFEFSVPN